MKVLRHLIHKRMHGVLCFCTTLLSEDELHFMTAHILCDYSLELYV